MNKKDSSNKVIAFREYFTHIKYIYIYILLKCFSISKQKKHMLLNKEFLRIINVCTQQVENKQS